LEDNTGDRGAKRLMFLPGVFFFPDDGKAMVCQYRLGTNVREKVETTRRFPFLDVCATRGKGQVDQGRGASRAALECDAYAAGVSRACLGKEIVFIYKWQFVPSLSWQKDRFYI